ncbi:glycosyl-4,4'-diaponeurosporenoate acyltransferase [Marinilactibacillus kalidii]|uniref:glycosyl-4,4'-diaponeurosporenoate acyltransferase CrtO family protein n=1 Tax=Marinilactibacillus kalidii TaxID=2820274 RepID=UPI001ABDDE3F|nr:glycosyl-4,4'-diaponeurosporenoate acyltransferase [Marinilactibacillus kalidii]
MIQVVTLIVINVVVWFVIHLGMSLILLKAPNHFFERNEYLKKLFATRKWEKEGQFWESYTAVKNWKDKLPDGASLIGLGYKKKHLQSISEVDYDRFILETKRAELTHWLILLPAPLFFFWNPLGAAWLNIIYAVIVNVPFIIIQRYNRPRLERIQILKQRIENRKK